MRLLMRRERILNVSLNHCISPDLLAQFRRQDEKSWTWAARDVSDGLLGRELDTFALKFKTPEICEEFKTALDSAVSAERELSFAGRSLQLDTETEAEQVCAGISSARNLQSLTLSGNSIGPAAAEAISLALQTQPGLVRADWSDIFTGRLRTQIPPAILSLTRGLELAQARLVELDLSDNALGPVGVEALTAFLSSPSSFSLQELRLNNTGCGLTGGKKLAGLLLSCHRASTAAGKPLALRVFALGRSRLESEGAAALGQVFSLLASLEEIILPQNGISADGLTALAESFTSNPNLRIINLSDNTFSPAAAEALAAALTKLTRLEVLDLSSCLLKSAGASLICRTLAASHLQTLRQLLLDHNELKLRAGLEIVKAVRDKANLTKLSIDGNQFGSAGLQKILEELEEAGKREILGEIEENEEPESDEEDQDVSDEEDEEEKSSVPNSVSGESEKVASVIYQFGSTGAAPSPCTSSTTGFSFKLPLFSRSDEDLISASRVEALDQNKEEKKVIDDKPSTCDFSGVKTESNQVNNNYNIYCSN